MSTTGRSGIEHNKYCGQISTVMRLLTNKDGYIISRFVKIDDAEAEVQKTSLKHLPINNHTVAGNKGKKKVSIIPWKYFSVLSSI